jgi:hypothetical protein
MNFFNHEDSQSNYGTCLSAAGDKADFLFSAFAAVETLQLNSSQLVPNISRMPLSYIWQKAQTIVVLEICFSPGPELRWLPHMDLGNPPFRTPCGAPQVHTKDYISLYLQTHTRSQGIQRDPLSQQATLSRSTSGHAWWKQTNKATQTGHILHIKFISGHAQASPEATSTRPGKHAYRCTIQQEVPPNQSNAAPTEHKPRRRPARHRQVPQPHLLTNARASSQGGPSAPTTPQRRARAVAIRLHSTTRPSTSACPDVRLLPLL